MEIKTIGVIGGGTMGNGIAHVAARSGLRVILHDIQQQKLDQGMRVIATNLDREVTKNRITSDDKSSALERIQPTTNVSVLSEADFIIEAVIEDIDIKLKVLGEMGALTRPSVILASNTSSISITRIASETKRPDKVIGMHFMNPVPVMTLVEVVRGFDTSDDTCLTTKRLAEFLGKTPVEVNDYPGFVSNRVLMPMINEAIYCVMEGVATPDAVDAVMKLGMNHPMGPLALADLVGLDVCLNVMEVLQAGLGDTKYRPCPLLRKMVDAGHLGRKSGRGFYQH